MGNTRDTVGKAGLILASLGYFGLHCMFVLQCWSSGLAKHPISSDMMCLISRQ